MSEPISFLLTEAALRAKQSVKWTAYGPEILPAWIADMDFALAPPIRAALNARIALDDVGYPMAYPAAGINTLFAERAAARYQWSIEPDQVEFFSDVVQMIYLALLTLTDAGAGVIIQTPIYPPFLQSVAQTGRRPVLCPLVPDARGYAIDFAALEAACDAGTRLLLLCHPHNPSGRAFRRDELTALAEIVRRHDLLVISDEIHADIMLDERAHIPFASLADDLAARTITLTSASKAFNIAGLCVSCAVFGSPDLKRRFDQLPGHVRGGRSALGMAATSAAWRDGDPWLNTVLAQLRANRDYLASFVATRWPAVRHTPPEATYLAWLDCRDLELAEEPWRFFLREAGVAVSPGPDFGAAGQGFVRLNFATSPVILEAILTRMDRALLSVGKSTSARHP